MLLVRINTHSSMGAKANDCIIDYTNGLYHVKWFDFLANALKEPGSRRRSSKFWGKTNPRIRGAVNVFRNWRRMEERLSDIQASKG